VREDDPVTADAPTILATSASFALGSSGPFSNRPGLIHRFAAELAGKPRAPRICGLYQATGDPDARIGGFYAAFAGTEFVASHLQLFPMPNIVDVRAHLLGQDVIWVGGGSVANLCAVWRAHGLDEILHEAWQSGVVMSGVSAGSICWHRGDRQLRSRAARFHRRAGLAAIQQRRPLRRRGPAAAQDARADRGRHAR
jgi:hypothetical protein